MEIKQEVFKYRFSNGMFMWPILRYVVTESKSVEYRDQYSNKQLVMLWHLLKGLKHICIKKKRIIYVTSTLFNIRKKGESSYLNTLDDYYFNVFPHDSVIYEYPDHFEWRFPKKNRNTYTTLYYIELLSHLLSRVPFLYKSKNRDVAAFIDSFSDCNLSYLYRYDKFLQTYSFFLNKFFKVSKSKFLVINCGCYGVTNAAIIFNAKACGMRVAEIQHGLPNRLAYRAHNEAELSTEYSKYYPDYILTFGDYWNKYFTLPVKCISMGHPHLCSYTEVVNPVNNIPAIIFISQPGEQKKLLEIAISLRKQTKIKILFRLHPAEVLTDGLKSLLENNFIELSDATTDLYAEFSKVSAVCGVYSTCLYEARAFNLNVFFLDTNESRVFMDKSVGIFINSSNDILEHLNDKSTVFSKYLMWKSGFSENYTSFVKSEIFID